MNKIILLLFILFSANIFAQTIYWQKYYRGFNANETSGNDIGVTNDGNLFIIGTDIAYDNSGIVIKINKYGEILNQIYIDSFSTLTCAPSSNNSFILSGSKFISNDAIFCLKINNTGNIDWIKTYDSTPVSQINNIILTSGNNYIGCGHFYYLTGYVIKFDTIGNKLWQKYYPAGFRKDYFNIIEGNKYYMLGGIRSDTQEDSKGIITKVDTSGNIIWEKDYFYNNKPLSYIIIKKLNNNIFLVAASIADQILENTKSIFFKIDESGNIINTYVNLPKFDNFNAFLKDFKIINENKFLFLIDNENSDSAKSSVYITDSSGTILKSNTFNYTDYIMLKKAYLLNDGYIFIGNSNNYLSYRENIFVIKTDTNLFAPNPVGINTNEMKLNKELISIESFPNPFNNFINLKINIRKAGKYDLQFYDCMGRLLMNKKNIYLEQGINQKHFDFSGYSTGIYFIKINIENYYKISKIIHIK